jgi:hypothetical protein
MVVGVNEEHVPVLVHNAAKWAMHLRLCADTILEPPPAALAPAAAHEDRHPTQLTQLREAD